jgi:hypothetical protein
LAVTGKDYLVNTYDARTAELIHGAAPQAEVAAVRGAPEWRQLSFRASGLIIELEITGDEADRRLVGQLIPRQVAVVEIRHTEGVTTTKADTLGRFNAEIVPLGPISLRCRLGTNMDQSAVVTGWITI